MVKIINLCKMDKTDKKIVDDFLKDKDVDVVEVEGVE